MLLRRLGDVVNHPAQCVARLFVRRERHQKRLRRVGIAARDGQLGARDDRLFRPLRVADFLGALRRLLVGRIRAHVHQAVDDLLLRRVHARRRAELVRPVSVDQRIQLLRVRRKAAIQLVPGIQAQRVGRAPARRRQQQRDKRQQRDDRAQALFLLSLLFLYGLHLLHGLLAGAAQRLARLFLQHALLAPQRRINRREGIRLDRVRPVAPTAQAAIVARAVGPPADAEPNCVDRAKPIQLAPGRQGIGAVFAHIALLSPPDHTVLIPDLLHGGLHARHVFNVFGRKRAGKVLPRLTVRARADKPPAEALILRVKADDIHLDAVDHLIRKVEKVDQAENLPVFICILGFPLNRHPDDLNRTG